MTIFPPETGFQQYFIIALHSLTIIVVKNSQFFPEFGGSHHIYNMADIHFL
jgi:hypothetical protein